MMESQGIFQIHPKFHASVVLEIALSASTAHVTGGI